MRPRPPSVFSFLSASLSARVLETLELGFGRSAALWTNARDRMRYERPEGHTISLYLKGGAGTRRLGRQPSQGWPGALCIMPQGQSSDWEITDPFEFVHLYMPDEELRRVFAETFDRDARSMVFPELVFAEAPHLGEALRGLAEATRSGDPLRGEEAMAEATERLFADPRYGGVRRRPVSGGLAPHVIRRLRDHVDAHLCGPIRLADLAGIAGLSEFHLQRMFRASLGISPHGFVAHARVERAKALLRGSEPIAAIAPACGFSSQSHLTRAFKAGTGVTPAAWRRLA